MIKVYIYVTGLVLFQFSADPKEPARALLARGGFTYPGLAEVTLHVPEITTGLGLPTTRSKTDPPLYWHFGAPQTDSAITPPAELIDISRLFPQTKVRSECLGKGSNPLTARERTLEECKEPSTKTLASAGLLEFSGSWTAKAVTDCGNGYSNSFDRKDEFIFARATAPWELFPSSTSPALPKAYANSVVFSTLVSSVDQLEINDDTLETRFESELLTGANCRELPDFTPSGAASCLVMAVRIGPSGDHKPRYGAALHFAALYGLMDPAPSVATDAWLPTVTKGDSCTGVGSGGGSHCIGGIVY